MRSGTFILIAWLLALTCGCKGNFTSSSDNGGDTVVTDSARVIGKDILESLPDTSYESVSKLTYEIINYDTLINAEVDINKNPYNNVDGVLLFRGTPFRNANMSGRVEGTPSTVEKVWTFRTLKASSPNNSWGGGSGWNGQPVYVNWSDSTVDEFKRKSTALTPDFSNREIIFGSLAGQVYFLNYETGKQSRKEIDVINTIKGSVSLDPDFSHPTLYVGQGIPVTRPFGCLAIDLFSHEQKFFLSDPKAWRSWGAFDSSPVVAGDFLFWPGENGTLYKMSRENGTVKKHTALRYKRTGRNAAGIESSLCVYLNYGYFGDNHGNILCVNLNTMRPVWWYDNHDDTDGSIVLDIENGTPVIYTGCEVDKQGTEGYMYFVKLNALNGELIWENKVPCKRWDTPDQHFDGGLYATPLLGKGDCVGLIFAPVCFSSGIPKGEFIAFDTASGEIKYRTSLKNYAWSSPVAFYNENSELFIMLGDCAGNVYLFRGKTGEILFCEKMGHNFESSPVVVDNTAVVGSRGGEIYKFEVK